MSVRTESPIFDALWDEFMRRDEEFEELITNILEHEEKLPAPDDTVEFVPSFPIEILDEDERRPVPSIFKAGEIRFNLFSAPVVPWSDDEEIFNKPFTVTIDTTTQHVPFFTPVTKLTLSGDEIYVGAAKAFVNDLPEEFRSHWTPRTSVGDDRLVGRTPEVPIKPWPGCETVEHHYFASAWGGVKSVWQKAKTRA